ncbi:MAG: LysR family transcriptional regulator [Roseibium aggregatum]
MKTVGLPPLAWLRAFEATARHLSFTRASQELNLTQSAVSQHVRSLETLLGCSLFVRKTRALELTLEGETYLPSLREAFDLITRSTQLVTGSDLGRNLTLQCNLAFSVYWLAPRLRRLYEEFPWLTLNIVTSIWDTEKRAADASLEIRFARPEDMPTAAIRLAEEKCYPVCSPGLPEEERSLESGRLFDCAGITGSWSGWMNSQGRPFAREAEVNLASTYVIAISAALNGAGLVLAHDTLVGDLLRSGDLVRPFEHQAPLSEAYFVRTPPPYAETPASKVFLDWIQKERASAR